MDAKKYYSLESKNDVADLYIFGDITSWPWLKVTCQQAEL